MSLRRLYCPFILVISGILYIGSATAAIPALPGDISSDNRVDLNDFAIMAEQWLSTGTGLSADLTGNEVVNNEDLAQLSSAWLDFMAQDAFATTASMASWTVVDEGSISAPSSWSVTSGTLRQTSNIYGPDVPAESGRKGTYLYWKDPAAKFWADYQFSTMFSSSDNDGIGVMFRYLDANNYYKFDMDLERTFRKLFKVVNGVESTIGYVDVAGYTLSTWATVKVDVQGDQINVFYNDTNVFGGPIVDSDIPCGTAALYCWGNPGGYFNDFWVQVTRIVTNYVAANDDFYEVTLNTPLNIAPESILDNDTTATGTLTAGVITSPTHGELELNADGTFIYTPDTDYYGPDSFVYEAAANGTTDQATVHLWVLSGQEFSIVLLPDTQHYSASYPAIFDAQTQWIVDNKTTHNIAFVLHEGDITNNNTIAQWINAESSISILDGEVPYVLTMGNHDTGTGGTSDVRNTTYFNTYFPVSRFDTLPQFGGVYEAGHMENSYHYFTAGGIDWLVISLEFGPRAAVLNWANTIVSAHPNHRVIVFTHNYMYSDDTRSGTGDSWNPHTYTLCTTATGDQVCNDGEEMWTNFIKLHPNMTFVFSGHILNDGVGTLVSTGDYGNPVYQMLANYQFLTNGGNGYLRIVKIYPAQELSKVTVQTYSPYLDSYNTASDQQFEFTTVDLTTP